VGAALDKLFMVELACRTALAIGCLAVAWLTYRLARNPCR
jgi:hypothetical protein